MPEGDTIHRAALHVGAAVSGAPLVAFAAPRLPPPLPTPGPEVGRVEARGKYLLVHFGDGLVLLTHLKMTGAWRVVPRDRGEPRGRAVITVPDTVAVCVRAPVVQVLDEAALRRHPGLRLLGPDLAVPGVDVDRATTRMGELVVRGTTIGDALLDQRPACGIGNVVMQEACHLAGVDPRTPVERVAVDVRRRLYVEAARILQDNVHTSRRTTVPDAPAGSLWVYDRSGRACRHCGTAIAYSADNRNARPTWWCPTCQPPG